MNTYYPDDSRIRIAGRTRLQVPLPLFWTGSGVELCADGSELSFILTADYSAFEQWIRVEVDGYSMIRMPLNKGENRVTVYRGLNPKEKRHVQLFKETQAMPTDPDAMLLLHAVETDGELYPLPARDLKIEFIGDSLTSGEGLAGAKHLMDWQSCVFSTWLSYTQLVAKELNAQISILAQSGWGTYCSWDHQTACAMPLYYDQICGVLQGERTRKLGAMDPYDFSTFRPDVVYVNLGSNDRSGLLEYSKEGPEPFARAMMAFLKLLRMRNPDALIIWACGLGTNGLTETAQETMAEYLMETGDERTDLLYVPDGRKQQGPEQEGLMGSRNHPGPLSNRYQADAVEEKIREMQNKRRSI